MGTDFTDYQIAKAAAAQHVREKRLRRKCLWTASRRTRTATLI